MHKGKGFLDLRFYFTEHVFLPPLSSSLQVLRAAVPVVNADEVDAQDQARRPSQRLDESQASWPQHVRRRLGVLEIRSQVSFSGSGPACFVGVSARERERGGGGTRKRIRSKDLVDKTEADRVTTCALIEFFLSFSLSSSSLSF